MKFKHIIMPILCTVMLSSCANVIQEKDDLIYNIMDNGSPLSFNGGIVFRDFTDYYFIDTDDENFNAQPLLHDVFNNNAINNICVSGDYIFYLCHGNDQRIIQIDIKDFSERIIYENNLESYEYFGIKPVKYTLDKLLEREIYSFFVHKDYLYIYNGGLYANIKQIHLPSGQEVTVCENIYNYFSFSYPYIYFVNMENQLLRYNVGSKKTENIIPEYAISSIYATTDEMLLFTILNQRNRLAYINSTGEIFVSDIFSTNFCADENYYYYINDSDKCVYKGKVDNFSSPARKLNDLEVNTIFAVQGSEYLYCWSLNSENKNVSAFVNKESGEIVLQKNTYIH